jgi:hypothetical protein
MSDPQSVPFDCPNCGAKYEIVRVELAPQPRPRIRLQPLGSCALRLVKSGPGRVGPHASLVLNQKGGPPF